MASRLPILDGSGESTRPPEPRGEPAGPRARVALVGSEYEENLSLRYLAAALEESGFETLIVPYQEHEQRATALAEVVASGAIAVGISVPFQARATDLLSFADELRRAGYAGHVCVGGHFATFEYEHILERFRGVDSVCRHEGEVTLRELAERLRDRRPLVDELGAVLPGLVLRSQGAAQVGGKRALARLDDLPFPDRRGPAHDVLGIRCAPLVGSRGCYADCSFCCIYAYAENADGARYRMRSPENIVAEMAREYHTRGVRLFVFHDDNFFLPYLPSNLKRARRLADLLRGAGLDDIALVVKCRPNDVDRELFEVLRSIGLLRLYIGIETNSDEGIVSLNRRISSDDNRRALAILRELDLYYAYNVLLFDPAATLDGVARNLDFMATYSEVPTNFCRAEVYAGTPLQEILRAEGRLTGDWLAWSYEMREPRVELLFRIAATAFHTRNFKHDGMSNLNNGIRFDAEVFRRFYPSLWSPDFQARAVDLTRRVNLDGVARLREAHGFVGGADLDDHAAVRRFSLDAARGVAAADFRFLVEVKALRREMEQAVIGSGVALRAAGLAALPWAAESARLGSSVGREISTELLPPPAAG